MGLTVTLTRACTGRGMRLCFIQALLARASDAHRLGTEKSIATRMLYNSRPVPRRVRREAPPAHTRRHALVH